MSNYYRITAYHPTENYSFIVDSYGRFEKLWQFSAYLVSKGLKVIEVATDEKFLDGNIPRAKGHAEWLYIQACTKGKHTVTSLTVDGQSYRAVEIGSRRYVPDRTEE